MPDRGKDASVRLGQTGDGKISPVPVEVERSGNKGCNQSQRKSLENGFMNKKLKLGRLDETVM